MDQRGRVLTLMAPPTLWLLLLFVLPMGAMALFTFRAGSFGAEREIWTLEHYRAFAGNWPFQRLLVRSAFVALLTALGSLVLAYPLAYYLAFHAGEGRLLLLTLILVPAWTSYLLRILAWKLILGSNGLLNSLLISLGLTAEGLPILLYSPAAVVITLIYVWTPFTALPIFAALQRIDRRLLEAAADLGHRPWEVFLRVTLPLSMPGVLAGFFFAFIPTVGEYVTPLLVGGARGVMYGNLIQDQFVRALNWPLGALMSLVMLVSVLLALLLFSGLVRQSTRVRL
jgi:spermidine/putrescine transport system permease protein